MTTIELTRRLTFLRKCFGTYEKIGRELNISWRTIWNWTHGHGKPSFDSINTITAICHKVGWDKELKRLEKLRRERDEQKVQDKVARATQNR